MRDTDSIDTDSVEAGNATRSGRIPSIKKATAAAIKSLIPKKRLRTNRSILGSDDEKSVNSVNIAIQNIFNNYYSLFNEGKTKGVLSKFVAKATSLKKSAKSKPVNDRDSDSEV